MSDLSVLTSAATANDLRMFCIVSGLLVFTHNSTIQHIYRMSLSENDKHRDVLFWACAPALSQTSTWQVPMLKLLKLIRLQGQVNEKVIVLLFRLILHRKSNARSK